MNLKKSLARNFALIAMWHRPCPMTRSPPPSREEIAEKLGEPAALAWDDMMAARRSYWRAVDAALSERYPDPEAP